MKSLLKIVAIPLVIITCALSIADDKDGNPTGLKTRGWSVDLAFSRDYQNNKSLSYYKISFKGDTITEKGSQWVPVTLGQAWKLPKIESDTDEFRFDLQDGISSLSSPMYEAYGVKPLDFAADFGDLRGAIQVAGRLTENQELNVGIGLESKPLSLIPGSAGVTNNLRIGLFGMKHTANGDTSKDFFSANYRAYVGYGIAYKRSENVEELVKGLVNEYFEMSEEERQELYESGDPNNPLTQIIGLMLNEELTREEQARRIATYYDGRIDQPTVALEFAAEGAYAIGTFVERRYNSLWSVTLQWWPNPEKPDNARFFLTYQNGFARADTKNAVTGFLAGYSFKF